MKFEEVLPALREGKKVTSSLIESINSKYMYYSPEDGKFYTDGGYQVYLFPGEFMPLDDWEIVKESKKVKLRDLTEEQLKKMENKAILYDEMQEKLKNGTLSDGYHSFNDLYYQRMILSATICNLIPEKCWKSKKHSDGQVCFDGTWFIIGFDTPEGQYTYHYELKYWDLFKCKELEQAPKFDGHTDKDVGRLLSLIKEKEKC